MSDVAMMFVGSGKNESILGGFAGDGGIGLLCIRVCESTGIYGSDSGECFA